jgi:hypothetical protein
MALIHRNTFSLYLTVLAPPNYVVLVLGNEGGGPRHMQGCHTWGLEIGLRKLMVLTLNIHNISNQG